MNSFATHDVPLPAYGTRRAMKSARHGKFHSPDAVCVGACLVVQEFSALITTEAQENGSRKNLDLTLPEEQLQMV